MVASNSLELGGLAELEHRALPAGEGEQPVLVGLQLAVAGALLRRRTSGRGECAAGSAASSSIFRMESISRLWVESWRRGRSCRRAPGPPGRRRPPRASTMAWKISAHLMLSRRPERSCGLEQPPVDQRPAHLRRAGCPGAPPPRRAGVRCSPCRTSTSPRRSAGSSTAGAADLAVLEADGALAAGPWSRTVPLQRDWPRRRSGPRAGSRRRRPTSTTRADPCPSPPRAGWRTAASRSGAVGRSDEAALPGIQLARASAIRGRHALRDSRT